MTKYSEQTYVLREKDVLRKDVKIKGQGRLRVKHFCQLGRICIYNERDDDRGVGRILLSADGGGNYSEVNCDLVSWTSPWGGLEDPRIFSFAGDVFVLCSGRDKNSQRNMYLYDVSDNSWVRLDTINHDLSNIRVQKNWTPYIKQETLYFIYSYIPLCVLQVVDLRKGQCEVIKGPVEIPTEVFGSTPLLQWDFPYFIGFAHTRHPHRSVPVIYDADKMELVRIGYPIHFANPPEAIPWRNVSVQFPYDLQVHGTQVVLSVEFEDRCPTWLYLDFDAFCKTFSI